MANLYAVDLLHAAYDRLQMADYLLAEGALGSATDAANVSMAYSQLAKAIIDCEEHPLAVPDKATADPEWNETRDWLPGSDDPTTGAPRM